MDNLYYMYHLQNGDLQFLISAPSMAEAVAIFDSENPEDRDIMPTAEWFMIQEITDCVSISWNERNNCFEFWNAILGETLIPNRTPDYMRKFFLERVRKNAVSF